MTQEIHTKPYGGLLETYLEARFSGKMLSVETYLEQAAAAESLEKRSINLRGAAIMQLFKRGSHERFHYWITFCYAALKVVDFLLRFWCRLYWLIRYFIIHWRLHRYWSWFCCFARFGILPAPTKHDQ